MGDVFDIIEDGEQVDRFEVRDLRVKTRYSVDNIFQDKYWRIFGGDCAGVYLSLVRHADKQQKSWPSQTRIAHQIDISRQWVGIYLKILQYFNLVRSVRVGKRCNNRYYLIDERFWKSDFEQMKAELEAYETLLTKVDDRGLGWLNEAAKEVMSPGVISLLGDKRCRHKIHHMLSKVTSNSKDKQKDKQKKDRKIEIKKAGTNSPAKPNEPKQVTTGKGGRYTEYYDQSTNSIVKHYFD